MTPCDGDVSSTQGHLPMITFEVMVPLLLLAKYVLENVAFTHESK